MAGISQRLSVRPGRPKAASVCEDAIGFGGVSWNVCLRLSGMASAVLSTALIVILLITRSSPRPNPAVIFGLALCGDVACFRGLIPGVTTWTEARSVFNHRTEIVFDPPDGRIRLFRSPDNETLERIRIRLPEDGSLWIGDVIEVFGQPCGIRVDTSSFALTLQYLNARFVSQRNQPAVRPDTSIVHVEITSVPDTLSCIRAPGVEQSLNGDRHWLGFASIERYLGTHSTFAFTQNF